MSSALTGPTETMPRLTPQPSDERGPRPPPQPNGGDASRSANAQSRQGNQPPQGPTAGAQEAGDRNDSAPGDGERATEANRTEGEQREVVNEVMAQLRQIGTALEFKVDDTLERPIVEVQNPDTEKVIRQIPPEEMLTVLKQLQEGQQGDEPQGVLLDVRR